MPSRRLGCRRLGKACSMRSAARHESDAQTRRPRSACCCSRFNPETLRFMSARNDVRRLRINAAAVSGHGCLANALVSTFALSSSLSGRRIRPLLASRASPDSNSTSQIAAPSSCQAALRCADASKAAEPAVPTDVADADAIDAPRVAEAAAVTAGPAAVSDGFGVAAGPLAVADDDVPEMIEPPAVDDGDVPEMIGPPAVADDDVPEMIEPPAVDDGDVPEMIGPPAVDDGDVPGVIEPPAVVDGDVPRVIEPPAVDDRDFRGMIEPPAVDGGGVAEAIESSAVDVDAATSGSIIAAAHRWQ
jgi:hypothetical protein